MRKNFLTTLEQFQAIQQLLKYKPAWIFFKMRDTYYPFSLDELQAIGLALGYKPNWASHKYVAQSGAQSPDSLIRGFLGLLELQYPFTMADLKRAYKTKAKQLHPDTGGTPEAFLILQEAYDSLRSYACDLEMANNV